MRIGIFSDVHGNVGALRATLEAYEDLDIEEYVCLGDVVGYGPDPDTCCDLVRPLVSHCVMGNHDAAVSGRMNYDYYYDAARTALDHHRAMLSETNREWLANLPYTVERDGLCFSHGSPIDVERFEYVFNKQQAVGLLPHWHALEGVTFIGHSHLTKSFALAPPEHEGDRVTELTGDVLELPEGAKYVCTVGSVGQPRDNDARACFTVFDTAARTLAYHRVDYDIAEIAVRIFDDEKLSPDFGKRLFLGI